MWVMPVLDAFGALVDRGAGIIGFVTTVLWPQVALLGSLLLMVASAAATFRLSNTLGDSMILQRGTAAVVWGFGTPGIKVTTTLPGKGAGGHAFIATATVGADGSWRQSLPPQEASTTPSTISFSSSDGGTATLRDVLFGDIFLCSGQSNMQYTPHSMAGMNNNTAEIAAADSYKAIRYMTVGQQTVCGDPAKQHGRVNCSEPFPELKPFPPVAPGGACGRGHSCREAWTVASAKSLGGAAWNTFSAVCWLFGRDLFDAMEGKVGESTLFDSLLK